MISSDQHYRLYRYLRSPIVDAGEGELVSHVALRIKSTQLSWFKEKTLKSLCFDVIPDKYIVELFGYLADGGVLITPNIQPDAIRALRKVFRFQVIRDGPFTIIKRLCGPPGEQPAPVRKPVGGKKKILMIRYGGNGDHLMISPLIQYYHDEGWYITYNVTAAGETIYKDDPRIDDLLVQEDNIIPPLRKTFDKYFADLGKDHDKTISLLECLEGDLLRVEGSTEFNDSWEKRHTDCAKNYLDHNFTRAGLDIKGRLPSIWLSDKEREWASSEVERVRRKLGKKFIVLWNIFGSCWHKAYPHMFDVFFLLKTNRDDIGVLAISDDLGKYVIGEDYNTVVYNGCAKYKIRQSLALHSAVDAVVTPETWSLTAAQGFPAPLIALLSHSSRENFTIRDQDIYLTPALKDCPCAPCHQIHYSRISCPRGVYNKDATLCSDSLPPGNVYQALMKVRSRYGNHAVAA